MLPTKADRNAVTFSVVQVRSANVAPSTTMASPSAMMMKPAQRSALWPPSAGQASTDDDPSPGVQNRTAGEMYSIVSATPHSQSRDGPSAKPPTTQKIADADNQTMMRMA